MVKFVGVTAILISCVSPQMVAQNDPQEVELGGSWFPVETHGAAGWEPAYSVYAGYLTPLSPRVTVAWSLEYFNHKFESNDPMSSLLYTNGTRTDIAVYPALRVGNIFEFAAGAYYSKRAAVYNHFFGGTTDITQEAGTRIRLYYHFGVEHSFSVSSTWKARIGIFVRDQDYGGVFPFALRAGVSHAL